MRRQAPLWILAVATVAACSAPVAPSALPRSAPRHASEQLPAEIDLVVRIDVRQLTEVLRATPAERLWFEEVAAGAGAAAGPLLLDALGRTRLLWFGGVLGPDLASMAKTLVLEGRYAEWLERAQLEDWSVSVDAGALRRMRLKTTGAGALEQVYLVSDEMLVWASAAHADAVADVLARRAPGNRLRPPERGTLAVALQPASWIAEYSREFPQLAARFSAARAVSGHLDLGGRAPGLEVQVDFALPEQALEAEAVLSQLFAALGAQPCGSGAIGGVRVTSLQASVHVTATLDAGRAAALGGCAAHPTSSHEPG